MLWRDNLVYTDNVSRNKNSTPPLQYLVSHLLPYHFLFTPQLFINNDRSPKICFRSLKSLSLKYCFSFICKDSLSKGIVGHPNMAVMSISWDTTALLAYWKSNLKCYFMWYLKWGLINWKQTWDFLYKFYFFKNNIHNEIDILGIQKMNYSNKAKGQPFWSQIKFKVNDF